MTSRSAARALALATLGALACTASPIPEYTRVAGRAPEGIPASGAVLVVLWATWCPPCVEELPALRALARDPPAGVRVVTFGEDADEAAVRAFFGGPPPPELGYRHDAGGAVAGALGVGALPAAFLSVNGGLVARFDGAHAWSAPVMRRLLAKLAAEGPAGAARR